MKKLLMFVLFTAACAGSPYHDTVPSNAPEPETPCEKRNKDIMAWLDTNCPAGIADCATRGVLPTPAVAVTGGTVSIGLSGALTDVIIREQPQWIPYCPFNLPQ